MKKMKKVMKKKNKKNNNYNTYYKNKNDSLLKSSKTQSTMFKSSLKNDKPFNNITLVY